MLGLIMIEEGEIQQGTLITQAVVVTVPLNLILRSITAAPGFGSAGKKTRCQPTDHRNPMTVRARRAAPEIPHRRGGSDTMTRCPHPTVPPTRQGQACIS